MTRCDRVLHLVDDAADIGEDIRLGPVAVDLVDLTLVLAHDRLHVGVVHLEPVHALLLRVVAALRAPFGDVRRGRVEREVVNLTSLRVHPAADDAFDDGAVRDVEEDDGVRDDAFRGDGVRLRRGPRVAVEEPAGGLGLVGVERLDDHADHHLVGDEVSAVHELLGALAEVGARRDRRAEEIARGDVLEAVLLDDELALGALARGGGAGDHNLLRASRDGHGDRAAGGGGRGRLTGVERPALLSAGELGGGDGECGGGHRLLGRGCDVGVTGRSG